MNKNVNRDYLVKVDIKSVEAIPPREDLRFYMTDVWTSNIFFQLVFEDSGNSLINSYAPVENAESYSITLRVVKPNNIALTIDAVPLSQGSSFFVADLTSDFIDVPGICKCELFIDTNINGRLERYTTNMFEYEVKYSIFYDLEELLGRSEYISIENVVTKDYMEAFVKGNFTLDGYVTDEELANTINNLPKQSYDDTELRSLIAGKADKSQIPTTLPANGGNADTIDNIHIWTGTEAEFTALTTVNANTVYIIKEG